MRRYQLQRGLALLLSAAPLRAQAADSIAIHVELPDALRRAAGQGTPSPVRMALVEAAAPRDGVPLLLASATSDAGHASSRALARHWRPTVLDAGCAIAAADADPAPAPDGDTLALRDALLRATLAALPLQWPWTATAPLLLAGFSGGAKYAAWLAALLAARGRAPAGLYLSGSNDAVLPAALRRLDGAARAALRDVPVFLHSGDDDRVAPPARQREMQAELRAAGIAATRLHVSAGGHAADAAPLREALSWFRSRG